MGVLGCRDILSDVVGLWGLSDVGMKLGHRSFARSPTLLNMGLYNVGVWGCWGVGICDINSVISDYRN